MIVAFDLSLSFAIYSVNAAFMFKSLKIWKEAASPASVPEYSGLDSAKSNIISPRAVTKSVCRGFNERLSPGFKRDEYSGSMWLLQAVMLVNPVKGFKLP